MGCGGISVCSVCVECCAFCIEFCLFGQVDEHRKWALSCKTVKTICGKTMDIVITFYVYVNRHTDIEVNAQQTLYDMQQNTKLLSELDVQRTKQVMTL